MPRAARDLVDQAYYHVLNRGNNQQVVFRKELDFHVFLRLLIESKQKHRIPIFGYCLMPNHFHIVLKAKETQNVGKLFHWALTCFAQYYHAEHRTTGHLWQGRYKTFLIDNERYLITVLRYVESNPIRAALVASCADWPWSSYRYHSQGEYTGLVDAPPITLPRNWHDFVDTPLTATEKQMLKKIREKRGQSPPGGTVPLNNS